MAIWPFLKLNGSLRSPRRRKCWCSFGWRSVWPAAPLSHTHTHTASCTSESGLQSPSLIVSLLFNRRAVHSERRLSDCESNLHVFKSLQVRRPIWTTSFGCRAVGLLRLASRTKVKFVWPCINSTNYSSRMLIFYSFFVDFARFFVPDLHQILALGLLLAKKLVIISFSRN